MVHIEIFKLNNRLWKWVIVRGRDDPWDISQGSCHGFVTACRQARAAYLKEMKKEH